jgi:hypothetical protein
VTGNGRELGGSFMLGPWRVRRAGYGAMQLAGGGVFGPPRDRDEALRVLLAATAAGVNHIDTAQFYGAGTVNELIREALYPYPDGLAIVSKVGARRDAGGALLRSWEARELRQGIEDNLRALQVPQIHVCRVALRFQQRPHKQALRLPTPYGVLNELRQHEGRSPEVRRDPAESQGRWRRPVARGPKYRGPLRYAGNQARRMRQKRRWLAKVSACTRRLGRRAALLSGSHPGLRGTLATWLTTPHGTAPSTTR